MNENTLSSNLGRIKDAANDMREVLELTSTDPIENLSDAVEVLKTENEEMAEELERYVPTDVLTEEEMDALLIEENYGKKFRYMGEDCKYKPGAVFEVKRKFKTDNIVKNFAGFHAASSLTNYTLSINCSISSKLLAFITVRDTNFTISEGWSVLGDSNLINNNPKQHMIIATKTATETLETLTVTQGSSQTMWLDIVELPAEAEIVLDGFTYPQLNTVNITAGPGCKMYGLCYVFNSQPLPYTCNPQVLHTLWDYYTTNVDQRQGVLWGYLDSPQNIQIIHHYNYNQTVALANITINNVTPDVIYNYYWSYTNVSDVLNNDLNILNFDTMDISQRQERGLESKTPQIQRILQAEHITKPYQLFYGLHSLRDIGKLDWSKLKSNLAQNYRLTNAEYMFYECRSLRKIPDLPIEFTQPYLINTLGMFRDCQKITTVPYVNTSLSTNVREMYSYCYNLTGKITIDISSVVENGNGAYGYIFNSCSKLQEIEFISSVVKQPTYFYNVFLYCGSLQKIDMRVFDLSTVTSGNTSTAFLGVPNDCLVIVADQTQKDWMNTNYSYMTNVQTVEEYEGGNN